MPHKAFLKKKSLLDRFKDDYGGHTGFIQSARAEHTWNNPLTRYKRTNKLQGWVKSFAGKSHIHKLARFNALQAGRNESYEDVKLDCLRYADTLELPNGVCVKVNATIRCPRKAAFVFRITGVYDAEPGNPSKYVIRGFYPVYGLERKPSEEFDIPCNDVSDIEQWIKSNEKGNRMQNEAMSLKGFLENLTEKLTKQFDLDEDEVKNYLDSHTQEMQELLDDKELSLKEKVLFVRSEITGEKDEKKSEGFALNFPVVVYKGDAENAEKAAKYLWKKIPQVKSAYFACEVKPKDGNNFCRVYLTGPKTFATQMFMTYRDMFNSEFWNDCDASPDGWVDPLTINKYDVATPRQESKESAEYTVHSYNDTDVVHYEDGTPEEWRCKRCGGLEGGTDGEPFGYYITNSKGKTIISPLCSDCVDDACDILNTTHGNVNKALGVSESKEPAREAKLTDKPWQVKVEFDLDGKSEVANVITDASSEEEAKNNAVSYVSSEYEGSENIVVKDAKPLPKHKSERLFNKQEMERIALSEGAAVSPYLVGIAHKILSDEYGWTASTKEEVAEWLGDHKQAFEHAYGQALRSSDDDTANVRAGIEAALDEEEAGVMNAEIAMMGEGKEMDNRSKVCRENATWVADQIKDLTEGLPVSLKELSVNTDPDDYYVKYEMTINGKPYDFYSGDDDFTIVDPTNHHEVSGGLSLAYAGNLDLIKFCDELTGGANEAKDDLAGYKSYSFKSDTEDVQANKKEADKVLSEFAEDVKDNTTFEFKYDWYDKSYKVIDTETNSVFETGKFLFRTFAENKLYLDDGAIDKPAGMKLQVWMAVCKQNEAKEPADEKLSYEKGHKNSKGEDAPWVIRSHKDNRVLASFPTKKEAEDQMQRMKQYSKTESKQNEMNNHELKAAVQKAADSAGAKVQIEPAGAMFLEVYMENKNHVLERAWYVDEVEQTITPFEFNFETTEWNTGANKSYSNSDELTAVMTDFFKNAQSELFEAKKSEAVESSFIKDFRARMDTMDGELYDEEDILGWGWEWKSQDVGYPNGAKTYFEYFTMVDNGVPYTLVVKWNSFNDTIVGYDLWQEHPSESKKSESSTSDIEKVFKDAAKACGVADKITISTDGDMVYCVMEMDADKYGIGHYKWSFDTKNNELEWHGDESTKGRGAHKKFDDMDELKSALIADIKVLFETGAPSNSNEGFSLELIDTIRVPAWLWKAYLFNDTNDLEPDEIETFEKFKETYKYNHLDDREEEPYFSSHNDFDSLGGDVYDVDVYKRSDMPSEKKSEAVVDVIESPGLRKVVKSWDWTCKKCGKPGARIADYDKDGNRVPGFFCNDCYKKMLNDEKSEAVKDFPDGKRYKFNFNFYSPKTANIAEQAAKDKGIDCTKEQTIITIAVAEPQDAIRFADAVVSLAQSDGENMTDRHDIDKAFNIAVKKDADYEANKDAIDAALTDYVVELTPSPRHNLLYVLGELTDVVDFLEAIK